MYKLFLNSSLVTVHGLAAWQMTHSVRHGPLLLLNLRFCPGFEASEESVRIPLSYSFKTLRYSVPQPGKRGEMRIELKKIIPAFKIIYDIKADRRLLQYDYERSM